jgi:hypothetical protein
VYGTSRPEGRRTVILLRCLLLLRRLLIEQLSQASPFVRTRRMNLSCLQCDRSVSSVILSGKRQVKVERIENGSGAVQIARSECSFHSPGMRGLPRRTSDDPSCGFHLRL